MPRADDKVAIENFTSPNWRGRVDRSKYEAMRKALMAVLPESESGISIADAKAGLLPHLPDDLFPGGAKAGWWLKAVQLDLEARGVIARTETSSLRLYRR